MLKTKDVPPKKMDLRTFKDCKSFIGIFSYDVVRPYYLENIENFKNGEPVVVFSLKDFNKLLRVWDTLKAKKIQEDPPLLES